MQKDSALVSLKNCEQTCVAVKLNTKIVFQSYSHISLLYYKQLS